MKFRTSNNKRIAVVIPCYRVRDKIIQVLNGIGEEVSKIYVIDDACPENTGDHVKENVHDPRVTVIRNVRNIGVGGSVIVGYKEALLSKMDIIVKLDGDGQMDPALIPKLIDPVLHNRADYVKGNRFWTYEHIKSMPRVRLVGNLVLSFFAKASSGYWNIFDPNNGFTAINSKTLMKLPLNKLDNRYFFESDMLFRLYLEEARINQFVMHSKYSDEKSNMRVFSITFEFLIKHLRNLTKRICYIYFIRDFSVASINLIVGLVLILFGLILGINTFIYGVMTRLPSATGTQILIAISTLSGLQFFLSFINADLVRVTSNAFGILNRSEKD